MLFAKRKSEKIQAGTRFEPMTSALLMQRGKMNEVKFGQLDMLDSSVGRALHRYRRVIPFKGIKHACSFPFSLPVITGT